MVKFQLTFSAICVVINVVASYIVETLKIPLLFLDTLGTMLGAVAFGPLTGVLISIVTNTLQAMLFNPRDFPFVIVNIAVAIIIGWTAKLFKFNYLTALISGLVVAIICPLIGTPIAVWVYGGLTGGGSDLIYLFLRKSGESIFTAAFLPRVSANLLDKIVCALLVSYLIRRLPMQLYKRKTCK